MVSKQSSIGSQNLETATRVTELNVLKCVAKVSYFQRLIYGRRRATAFIIHRWQPGNWKQIDSGPLRNSKERKEVPRQGWSWSHSGVALILQSVLLPKGKTLHVHALPDSLPPDTPHYNAHEDYHDSKDS